MCGIVVVVVDERIVVGVVFFVVVGRGVVGGSVVEVSFVL